MPTRPQVLGLKRSFGFGDRLGLATPGHLDAVKGSSFAPIFAQQSIRELTRTRRKPEQVMTAAVNALETEGWSEPWGADADHLQTKDDCDLMVRNGYTFFTIDPSAHVNSDADEMDDETLVNTYDNLCDDGDLEKNQAFDLYLGKSYDLGDGHAVSFDDKPALTRAIIKYGLALVHTAKMKKWIDDACAGRPYELEMSVDETPNPTSPLEHLYIGLELKRLGVSLVSLAPRFVGEFEKGIDYKGDLAAFEKNYALQVAIAKHCGPYKLSVHSGSDKFSIYPIVGKLSGELLHVKTAGTSYLEALRVVCRTDVPFFREIVAFCRGRYDTDKATYHVSGELDHIPAEPAEAELEKYYLEHESGRQILHVTFGSILSGETGGEPTYKARLLENLNKNLDLYREVLHTHLGKHIKLLESA